MTRPNGMAREAALVSREKTLPRYSWFDRFLKNRILHTVKWSGNSHNSTAHTQRQECVWRQKPGEHIANAHGRRKDRWCTRRFLKPPQMLRMTPPEQHTNRKSNFSGRGMGGVPLKYDIQMRGTMRTDWHIKEHINYTNPEQSKEAPVLL